MAEELTTHSGIPFPFGVSKGEKGTNFSIHSKWAASVTLCLFHYHDRSPLAEFRLDPNTNKTGDVWHIQIESLPEFVSYGYRVKKKKGKFIKGASNPDLLLLDPYAKLIDSGCEWGECDDPYAPLGLVSSRHDFDWEEDQPLQTAINELICYEMHVRAFTRHPSSGVQHPGSYLGVIEKIPYLKDLGINAVKLMPIHEFNECEYHRFSPFTGERLYNFWGYSTVNFFSPTNRYAAKREFGAAVAEFKTMVKELHKAGIEVILDVVFNHTAEGNLEGPILSFKGIDCSIYYQIDPQMHLVNFTGCGNTVNCNHPVVRDFIRTCLQYWVTEMHVDGFRFDLAAIMCRGQRGEPLENPPLIEELSDDPILAGTKLIAEPWDLGTYMLGNFFPLEDRWSEWNDKYRDSIRRFIKGDRGEKRQFATRICGSEDLYGAHRSPKASINFITAHDGFTLRDLVSYNQKHNSANSEDNRDGNPNNTSWNCGAEGETEDPEVLKLRLRQMKNFHLALMISLGVPMIAMGNEYGHTRYGNNNAWCQDNELNWLLWDEIEKNKDFFTFYKELIHFRKRHPAFLSGDFWTPEQVVWHSTIPDNPDWEGDTQFVALTIKGSNHLYIAFNMHHEKVIAKLPDPQEEKTWRLIVNTANGNLEDFYREESAPTVEILEFTLHPHSAIVLKSL